jgi:hypothetical protein
MRVRATGLGGRRCVCGAAAETGKQFCCKCRVRARWTRRRATPATEPAGPSSPITGEVMFLIIPLSALALLGAVVWFLIRYAGLRLWYALVCALFGFFVASTTVAPQIRSALSALIGALSGNR